MAAYIALIRKDPDTDFGVSFPDFPGCITAGSTLDEAMAMAREALAFHIKGMVEDGDAIPLPSSLEAVMADPDNRDGVAVLVEAPEPKPAIERVNVTFDKRLLAAIDQAAAATGMTRSGYLAVAARAHTSGSDAGKAAAAFEDFVRRGGSPTGVTHADRRAGRGEVRSARKAAAAKSRRRR